MTNVSAGGGTMGAMASKGKPSPRSAVKPLSDEQVAKLAQKHHLVDPTHDFPTGPRKANTAEIEAQNPKATHRLLAGCDVVLRNHSKVKAWGLEHVPETGPFITAATHVTMYDVFVPMVSLFHQGRRPRYMAKAEMAKWPLIGKWFQLVGMQPVQRRAGKAKAIEETSVEILTSGRPLTVWPEGTVTRDPQKWPMSMKNGVGVIALESSRRLGCQVPLYCAVTWGAASINHWWPWPRKNVVMGCGGHPGRAEASAHTKQNRNRAKRDGGDAVPYTLCHCEERSDAAIRSPQPEETDSHASVYPKGTCFAARTGAE